MSDDITNKRFADLDSKVDAIDKKVDGLRSEILTGFANSAALQEAVTQQASAERSKFHREQMGRFDTVIEQTRSVATAVGRLEGHAEKRRDEEVRELRAAVESMTARIESLEQRARGGGQ